MGIRDRISGRGTARAVALAASVVLSASVAGCTGGQGGIASATGGGAARTASPSGSSGPHPGTTVPGSSGPGSATSSATAPSTPSVPPSTARDTTGTSQLVADPLYPQYGDQATDVLHYGLDLAWDPQTQVLTGTATLTIRAADPTDHFTLDLAEPMALGAVTVDGASVTAPHDGQYVRIPLGSRKPAGSVSTVVLAYHGTPHTVSPPMVRADIPGVGAQVTADGGLWAQQEPYGAFTWYPCDDQPSDKALYDVTITAPDGYAGVSGGAFLGRTEDHGRGVYRWHQPDPVSTYLVAFAVEKLQEETATGPHGLPITYWYPADAAQRVHQLTARVPGMIAFLEQHYGPYPFPTAGVLFLDQLVGMETQTMITLGTMMPPDDLLHEFAHQWFGDAVTPTTWSDLWLNEGFAMYSQYLWDASHGFGFTGGPSPGVPSQGSTTAPGGDPAAFDAFMQRLVLSGDQRLRTQDGPPGHFLPTHFASSNVYVCPALMLNEIRHKIGDTAFYSLLTDWSHHAPDSSQDRASFIAYANRHTGQDLTVLIDAWLDSPTTPATTYGPAASATTASGVAA